MSRTGEQALRALSDALGWAYVLAWSASFYPQFILNWRRKSTVGLTVDFPLLNVTGFVSYTILTGCFLFSSVVRQQYAERHPLSPEPTVRINDFAFAMHALVLTALTYSQLWPQLWGFQVDDSKQRARASTVVRLIVAAAIGAVLVSALMASTTKVSQWQWIDVVYTFGHIKLVATFVKYIPQAWSNYRRKSTRGWSIGQILFDLTGGILSFGQLLIDAGLQGDWSGLRGNAVKLGLSAISFSYDLAFITQHYFLYGDSSSSAVASTKSSTEEARPLLDHDRDDYES